MNFCVDMGNTNTVIGVFKNGEIVHRWRIATLRNDTIDDIKSRLLPLFIYEGFKPQEVSTIVVSSVVPMWRHSWERFVCEVFGKEPYFVEPGMKTGVRVAVDNPKEVGADRIVNSVAAIEKYPQGCIVVDSGTAVTIDIVSPDKAYIGGAIMPGITMSLEALASKTAKLSRVYLERPEKTVGKSTVEGIKSGMYYGFVGMIDRVIEESLKELDFSPRIVATGGLAGELTSVSKYIEEYDRDLTLTGLNLIANINRG